MKLAFCMALAGLFASAAPKAAPEPTAETYVARIQRYYQSLDDFSAEFVQRYSRVALSKSRESRGTLMLKKPNKMRWAYREPNEKYWIVDGKTLYIYDPEFEEVYIDSNFETEELSNSIRFFWGKGKLTDVFHAKLGERGAHGLDKTKVVLELTPKKDATYAKLVLAIDGKTGEVAESVIFETSGNTNHFRFKNVRINQGLRDDLFHFQPPPGAEIIRR